MSSVPTTSIETRSLPTLARSYPRRFTFYVASPGRSIVEDLQAALAQFAEIASAAHNRGFHLHVANGFRFEGGFRQNSCEIQGVTVFCARTSGEGD